MNNKQIKFETKNGVLYNGDCLEIMKNIPTESIDLTVTSPPYDNMRNYKGYILSLIHI